jgi:hypothetical protein
MTVLKKIINFGLSAIIMGSISWFLIHEFDRHDLFPTPQGKTIVKEVPGEEKEPIDWVPLVPAMSSVSVFFLRYFLIERRKKKKTQVKEVSLLDHILFDTIEDLIANDIPHMRFSTLGRTEMFRALLCQQLETFRDQLKDFIQENPSFESSADFRKKLRQRLYKIVEECEHEWRARQIPKAAVEKYNHFFRGRIELLSSDITMSSLLEGDPEEALESFLNEVRTVFKVHMQRDVMNALNSLNGELDGLTYNGKKL